MMLALLALTPAPSQSLAFCLYSKRDMATGVGLRFCVEANADSLTPALMKPARLVSFCFASLFMDSDLSIYNTADVEALFRS